jgi:hypothetical protein
LTLWIDTGGDKNSGKKTMKLQWTEHSQDVFLKRKIPGEGIDQKLGGSDLIGPDKADSENHSKGARCH